MSAPPRSQPSAHLPPPPQKETPAPAHLPEPTLVPAPRNAVTQVRERPPAARPAPPSTSASAAPRASRLAWLDALRGVAALFVVFAHVGPYVLPQVHRDVYRVFDPGLYGVLVFFMVSGYIVPASLERKGSIRGFWLSRAFRLFPLFILAAGGALLLASFGDAPFRGTQNDPAAALFAHLFMLGDVLGGSNIINVLWTLSYEMVFYLLITALFTVGLHRRSGRLAAGFAAGALLLGGLLPTFWLYHSSLGHLDAALIADLLVFTGIALAVAGHRIPRAVGAWLAAATGLTLVAINERVDPYEGLTILALMFTGTMLYRAERGQMGRRRAAVLAVGVFAAVIAAGAWHIPAFSTQQTSTLQLQWVFSVALAGLTFAIGLALRNVRIPAAVAWLGLVSYSVYLIHPLLIDIYYNLPFTAGPHSPVMQAVFTVSFLAVLLAACAVTYYLVEAPMQRLGRRLAARLEARLGPDRTVTSRAPATT